MNQSLPRPVERVVAQLQQHGRKVEPHSGYWMAQCPAHDDPRPSLSIREGRDGRALLKCHAGCPWRKIAAALGLEVRELFLAERPAALPPGKPNRREYGYRDAAGTLVYQVVRTPDKKFWARRPDGKGGWVNNLDGVTPVPYRLPELRALPPGSLLFIGEGEKVVECLVAHGLNATTNHGGAGKWGPAHSRHCRGLRIGVLPDEDEAGRAHASAVLASLREEGGEAALLALPGLPPKGDAVEWFQAGGTAAALEALAHEALAAATLSSKDVIHTDGQDGKRDSDGSADEVAALSVPLPAPLAPEAFHGIAGEIVHAIEPYTEADPAALLVTFLTAIGNLIGPGPHARVGPTHHPPKLFVVIFGPTSKGRKGTSEDHVRALLQAVDKEWETLRLFSGISSGEGIIHQVRDPVEGEERDPKHPAAHRVLRDEGVSDKRLLIIESEFAHLLKVMNREGNTVSPVVRLAWDDKPLQNTTKNSPAAAIGSHISLLGHSTQPDVIRYLSQTDAANGFGNRFLWVWAMRSKILPFPTEVPGLERLAERLRNTVARAREIGAVEWSVATRPLWAAAYPRLSEGRSGLLGAVTSRAEAQVLRLATLYALLDGSAAIQPCHLLAGLAVWRYCEASARYLFGDSTGDPAADAVLERVRQCPEGVARLELRDLLHRHCSAARLTRILDRLVVEGLLRRVKRTDTGGRPAELLLPTEAALAGGDDPLALARRLAAAGSESSAESAESAVSAESAASVESAECAESAVTLESPTRVSALCALSAHCSPAISPPPSPDPAEDEEDAEDEFVSPWEPPRDRELDRALDRAFDPGPDEETDDGSPQARGSEEDELALDLGPEEEELADEEREEDDDLAAVTGGGVGWVHEEL